MNGEFVKEKYHLLKNPFPPAASGLEVEATREIFIPEKWKKEIDRYYRELQGGRGAKAFPIVGEYGSGKTVLLKNYLVNFFEARNIKAFYFENPGVEFYDLANALMRSLGRYEFSKALWERCKEHMVKKRGKLSLFPMSFGDYLGTLKTKVEREKEAREIMRIIKDEIGFTTDEEVAYRFGLMIVETASKPYFSYRDFVAGPKDSLVAEKQEPKYFKAVIKAICEVYNVEGVAFLIDEFEEIAFPKRMTKKKTYEYLITLKRLIDVSEEENLWIVLGMVPSAMEETKKMDTALWQRLTHQELETVLTLATLDKDDCIKLFIWWLDRAREESSKYKGKLFPFPDEFEKLLDRPEIRYPRPLIKIGFFTLSRAENKKIEPPIPIEFIQEVIDELYPPENEKKKSS